MPRSGSIVMISGGALAVLGGAFLWRGWARYRDCEVNPPSQHTLCTPLNAPFVTGMVLAPLGMATLVVGGAVALLQSGDGGRR